LRTAWRTAVGPGSAGADHPMTRPRDDWNVLPHGELTAIDANLLTVVGELRMPLMNLPRRMTVVRLRDRRLIIWSAIALDRSAMSTLEAFGRPAYLVVPSDHHRLDASAWKHRYPDLIVVAPEGSRARVAEVVAVDTAAPDFGDPDVEFLTVPGTRAHEAALVVRPSGGTTLVLNDLVGNIRDASGIDGMLLRLAGFAGNEARIPAVVRLALVKDAEALRSQLLQWADMASLKRILVSHGDPIDIEPQGVLRKLAGALK
jgi:hypothetical protein